MKRTMILGVGALMAGVAGPALAQTASEAILNANTNAATPVVVEQTETKAVPVGEVDANGNPQYKVIETHTTVKQTQTVVPVNSDGTVSSGPAQPETVEAVTGQPFDVLMPDGTRLEIMETEWWKDPRLDGYTRFWFDTKANAYRPVVEKENTTYEKRENIWCTPEQASAGKC